MAMEFKVSGNPASPLLVCVPKLLGSPDDFVSLISEWQHHFCVILLDPNSERRNTGGLSKLTQESLHQLDYNFAAQEILEIIDQNFPGRNTF